MNLSIEQEMTRRGFRVEHTGGNCTAFILDGFTGIHFLLVNEMACPTKLSDPCEFWCEQSNGDTEKVSDHATVTDFLHEFDVANPELVEAL